MPKEKTFENLLKEVLKRPSAVIAIDGRCCAGKSSFALWLASLLPKDACNIFKIDDFFAPRPRSSARKAGCPPNGKIGGNIDVKRFQKEVLKPLCARKAVLYKPYNCRSGKFGKARKMEYREVNIIEGSYSMLEAFLPNYDLRIFMTTTPASQHKRLAKRESKEKIKQFEKLWIPLEEKYFKEKKVCALADVIIKT